MKANERSQNEFLSRFGIFKRLDCEKMSGEKCLAFAQWQKILLFEATSILHPGVFGNAGTTKKLMLNSGEG